MYLFLSNWVLFCARIGEVKRIRNHLSSFWTLWETSNNLNWYGQFAIRLKWTIMKIMKFKFPKWFWVVINRVYPPKSRFPYAPSWHSRVSKLDIPLCLTTKIPWKAGGFFASQDMTYQFSTRQWPRFSWSLVFKDLNRCQISLQAGRYALPRNGNIIHLDHYRLLCDYHPPWNFLEPLSSCWVLLIPNLPSHGMRHFAVMRTPFSRWRTRMNGDSDGKRRRP